MAKMKLVYICSPHEGNAFEEMRATQQYCRNAYELECLPVAPHLYLPQFLEGGISKERDLALRICLRLMNYCSEVWVHGERISAGMRGEIEYAEATGKPIIYIRTGKDGKEMRTVENKRKFEDVTALVDYEDMQDLIEEGIVSDLY